MTRTIKPSVIQFLTFTRASAVFYCNYPDEATSIPTTQIKVLDFGRPVLALIPVSANELWVSLDTGWSDGKDSASNENINIHSIIYMREEVSD